MKINKCNFANNYKKIVTFLFLIVVGVTYINSNIGVLIGGLKINLADFIIVIYWLGYLSRYKFKIKNILNVWQAYKWWIFLLLMFVIWIPYGSLAGAGVPEDVKLIRNLLYVISTLYFFQDNAFKIEIIDLIEVYTIITSLDTIVDVVIKYSSNSWFMFSRGNGVAHIYLFCFLLWNLDKRKTILQKIRGYFCCILTIVASFLSQERTQLLAILLACIITFLLKS
ncbi:hypothetical protein [Blautia sp. HCP28S3_G10]|uniref:hypothetical protein n=1 Tax=Blautia sp. HCP28S3_G10 TaxID=3438908 RepID=UPI003F8C269D